MAIFGSVAQRRDSIAALGRVNDGPQLHERLQHLHVAKRAAECSALFPFLASACTASTRPFRAAPCSAEIPFGVWRRSGAPSATSISTSSAAQN